MNHFSLPPSEASTGGSLKDSLSSQVLFASPFSLPSLTTMQQIPQPSSQSHQQPQPQQPQQNVCISQHVVSASQLNLLQPCTSIQLPISNFSIANNLQNVNNKTTNSSDAEDWGSITTMLFTREFQRQQLQQQQQQQHQQYQLSQLSSHQTLYEPSQGHIIDINNSCPSPMLSAIHLTTQNINTNSNTASSEDQTKQKSKHKTSKPLNLLLENAINKALVNSYAQQKAANSQKNSPISSRSPSTSRQPSISQRIITPKSKKEQQEIIKPPWNQGLNTPNNRKSSTIGTRSTATTTPSRKISEQNLKNITIKQQSSLSKSYISQHTTPSKPRDRSSLSKENHDNCSPSGQPSSSRNSYQPSNHNHNHRHQNCKYPDGADSGGNKQQLKKEYQQKPYNLFQTCSSRKKHKEQTQLTYNDDEDDREINNSHQNYPENEESEKENENSERRMPQTSISVVKCSTPQQAILRQTQNSDLLRRKISYCCLCANQISSDSQIQQTKQLTYQQQPAKCIYEELCLYLSNNEVRNFMYVSFAVSNTLVSGSWKTIPTSYFVSLVVEEYPEVLLDRQIGEALVQELKTIMSRLLSSKENSKFMCLDKLESITKNTGLLGLILAALKLLTPAQSHEDSGMSLHNNSAHKDQEEYNENSNHLSEKVQGFISKPKQQPEFKQHPVRLNLQLSSRDSKNKIFEDQKGVVVTSQQKQVATTLISLTNVDDSQMQNALVLQSKDHQNIFNLLQENCESLLIEMEHQVYSKFYSEMRRLTMKYKQIEQLLRLVQSKVSDHYDVISESSIFEKKIKELETKNLALNNQIRDYQSQEQSLQVKLHNLSQQNQLLSKENEKMEERCSKYMEICLSSMQQLCENQGALKNQLSDLVQGQRQNYQLSNLIEEKKRFLKEQLIFIKSESIRQSKEEIHRGNQITDIESQSSQQFAETTTVSRKLTESLTVNDGFEENNGYLNRISIEIESVGNIHLNHEKAQQYKNPQIFRV